MHLKCIGFGWNSRFADPIWNGWFGTCIVFNLNNTSVWVFGSSLWFSWLQCSLCYCLWLVFQIVKFFKLPLLQETFFSVFLFLIASSVLNYSCSFDKSFKTVSVFFISSIVVLFVSHNFITLYFTKVKENVFNFENYVSLNSSLYFQWLVKAQTSNPLF